MNTNIKQFAIPLAIIALVLLTIYKVFGSEDPVPTREDMKRNSIEQYKEENARIETHNKMTEALCLDEASRIEGAIESARYNLTCLEKNTKTLIDIDKEIAKEYGTGTTTGTASGTPVSSAPERKEKELDELFKKVCDVKPSSPVCDRTTFERLYKITEERIPGKNFFPILLGITNAESSLGTAYAKNNKGGFCTGYNNLGGIKWKKTDDGKSVRDQKIPDANGCYLYKFESIDEYWISKVNTVRYGYKGCINSPTPVRCMAFSYVGDKNVAEQSWINNTSIFLK